MTKRVSRVAALGVAIVMAALVMSGCSNRRSSGGGSGGGTGPTPVPDQSQYPALPDIQIAKAADGTTFGRMRAVLMPDVKPMRGSEVKLGGNCIDIEKDNQCFVARVELQFDGIDDPNVGMGYELYWSLDGLTPTGSPLLISSMNPGERITRTIQTIFDGVAPKYLIAKLSHGAGGSIRGYKDPAEEGVAALITDYKPKR